MTEREFAKGWRGGQETSKLLHITSPFCTGYGADLGCELDPHPGACVYVDAGQIVHNIFQGDRPVPSGLPGLSVDENGKIIPQVHIRNIEGLFPDWPSNTLDFVYSSHLIEHVRDPREFIRKCLRIIKPGGYFVTVGPHEDWYWPNNHPDCNPDHNKYNWQLNQSKVAKWIVAVGGQSSVEVVHQSEHGWDEDNWSFVVIAKKKLGLKGEIS